MKTKPVLFSPMIDYSKDYCFEKIQGAISGWNSGRLGLSCLEEIAESIKGLRRSLETAGILASDRYSTIRETIQEIEYPVGELLAYLKSSATNRLNAQDANIFLFFIEEKWKLLREMAVELDARKGRLRS